MEWTHKNMETQKIQHNYDCYAVKKNNNIWRRITGLIQKTFIYIE